jgi:hypothetical protein
VHGGKVILPTGVNTGLTVVNDRLTLGQHVVDDEVGRKEDDMAKKKSKKGKKKK